MSLGCVEEPGLLELPCSEIDALTQHGSDQKLPLRHDCHAGCCQRPGRGDGSLGALPRCISAPASLSANFRSIVYSIHVCTSSEPNAAFAYLLQVYETSDFIDEKLHVLGALGRFPSVKLKTRSLELAVAGGVRSQGIHSVFGSVAADRSTVAWEYVQAKWDALNAQYSQIVVGRILCVPIANFETEQAVTAVESLLVGRPKARLPVHWRIFENIRTGTAMYARDVTPLAAWIQML
ncbi:hypothetical protein DYB26_010217 [Aphanomyces astaci]|uniref:ERAP1-like C-terminal domain-containing protein n=1 Tax=Aphanomyces astaci TaxID=112090 RepID=A0A3R7AUY8_APHAT|nr:hypothetical protein DYB26_010217 [Aphanomyces astaci]